MIPLANMKQQYFTLLFLYIIRYIRYSMTFQPRRGLFSQLSPRNQMKINESSNKKLSFNSLSKNKQKNQEWGSAYIVYPSMKSPNILHSQVRDIQSPTSLNCNNKENVSDEYRLFSNLLKNQISKETNQKIGHLKYNQTPNSHYNLKKQELQASVIRKSKVCPISHANSEYFAENYQLKEKNIQRDRTGTIRPESKHKVEKYFQQNSVIRPKSSNKENENKFNSQKSIESHIDKKMGKNYDTFPPNQYYNCPNRKFNVDQIDTEGDEKSENVLDNVNTSTSSLKFDMSPFF